MSLVNKVLRDLDARRAGEGERTALPAAVTPLAVRLDRSTRWPWIAAGALAIAVAVGLATFLLQGGMPHEGQAAAPPPVVAAAPALPPMPAAAPENALVNAPANALPSPPAPMPAEAVPTREEPAAADVSGLRLSDELRRVPEPRKPAPAAGAAQKPAQARPAPTVRADPLPAVQRAAADNVAAAAKAPPVPEPAAEMRVEKQERKPTPAESADNAYRRGVAAHRQGSAAQAAGFYRQALELYPEHGAARQALVGILLEARQFDDAEEVLRRGIEIAPARMASVLSLARLKVEKGDAATALDLLLRNAAAGERSPEYQGFVGALLNRAGRSGEAIERYQSATRLAPAEARWWVGLGISLDAGGRAAEAREAYLRARGLPGLPTDLVQHVEQRLR